MAVVRNMVEYMEDDRNLLLRVGSLEQTLEHHGDDYRLRQESSLVRQKCRDVFGYFGRS